MKKVIGSLVVVIVIVGALVFLTKDMVKEQRALDDYEAQVNSYLGDNYESFRYVFIDEGEPKSGFRMFTIRAKFDDFKNIDHEEKKKIILTLEEMKPELEQKVHVEVEYLYLEYGVIGNKLKYSLDKNGFLMENDTIIDKEEHKLANELDPKDVTVSSNSGKVTTEKEQAVKSAKSYIAIMPFSYEGLVKQLEYDGYTNENAKYGATNCGADWYEQACISAQDYLDIMSFSRSGLIEQLEYDGYTHSQAVHGVDSTGL